MRLLKRNVSFQIENVETDKLPEWLSEYSEDKFAVAKTCFLSTRHNSHELNISKDVLEQYADTILGNFLVAKLIGGDSSSHMPDEVIYGYYPKEQSVEFVQDGDITKANAYVVLSKQYGKEFNEIFMRNNFRSTSVEMTVTTTDEDEHNVVAFDIYGLTCLGENVRPSCADADMRLVRFSKDDAENFFKRSNESLHALQKFAEERKQAMAEGKTYKVDKSKDAVSDKAWGDVDKTALRNKIMEASNRASLVKDVYALVEDGWEDAPSEKLKYPIMELKGDTFVYNRGALASALGYARQHNETSVVNKIEGLYKKLRLDDSDGKEEDTKMAEIKFAAVDIGDMWGKMWDALHAKYPDGDWGSVYRIDGIYEEDNKKFAIIHHKDEDTKYRLDFSLTEDGLTLSDEIVKVEVEIVETDVVKKFAEPENADKYKKFEDCNCEDDENESEEDDEGKDVEMSVDEMKAKMAKMESEIEDRDNIIMDKDQKLADCDKELCELRAFKAGIEEKEKMQSVEAVLAEVENCLSEDQIKAFREEGVACSKDALFGFINKVKALAFEQVKDNKTKKSDNTLWSLSAPVGYTKQYNSGSVWDRI